MKTVTIHGRKVGVGEPPLVIAEGGINHNGSLELARELVRAAAKAGADVIKFQTHFPECEMLRDKAGADYIGGSFFELLDRCKLSHEDHRLLKEFAEKEGILFLSTPFSREAADFLEGIGVAAFKVGSGELTNLPLLQHIARKGKPMILSTGMSELEEIEETLRAIRPINDQLILLQCTSTYPTPYEHINLGVIGLFRERFDLPTGLSDHSEGIYTAIAAVALGACVLEKHFTVDRNLPGPDQKASVEPAELAELVKGARAVFRASGKAKQVIQGEKPVQEMARESVVALEPIEVGSRVTAKSVWVKRPGTGIPAKLLDRVIGKRARRPIQADSLIQWSDLEECGVTLRPR